MEGAEQSGYLARLKAEFDSCDAAASGFLGPQEVTALCRKLRLPLVPDSLLGGGGARAGVDFEAFKDILVGHLRGAEDSPGLLGPAVADEVEPKFVKGDKRYGRRSRPDARWSAGDAGPAPSPGVREPDFRRTASLDSVESLKKDEEAPSVDFRPTASRREEGESARDGSIGLQPDAREHHESEQVTPARFRDHLRGSAPICCSTPLGTAPEDGSPRRASPSAPGPDVLSRLDDGSGCASPERLVALWSDEGVRDAQDILQALDLPAEERVSLRELTMALDNELLAGGNGIHRAALISYKNEIQHLRARAEQARGERDKAKADLERAERRNLQLLREADERLAGAEALNRTRIRELERDFRERLAAQRGQAEQESEAATQQLEREGRRLRRQLSALGAREAELREELAAAAQEKSRLEEELAEVKRRLSRAEKDGQRLRRDLTQLLRHELDGALNPEDKLARLREDCERRCRELRDQNDELSSELELLRSHKKSRRESPCAAAAVPLSWSQTPPGSESDSDDGDMKRRSSSPRGAASGPDDSAAAVSIETEFALEKLKSKHQREIRQLNVQLETQVDYYERSLERMRHSMELERKDMAQAFKLEISEREEQKAEAERQARSLKEALDSLRHQLQRGERSSEQERRTRRERADSEQNFAREIENLVQKLSAEKDQLEAELKLKMDQEVMTVREEAALELTQMKLHHAEGRRRLLRRVQPPRQKHQQRDTRRRPERYRQLRTRLEREKRKRERRKLQEEEHLRLEQRMLEEDKQKLGKRKLQEEEHLRQEESMLEDDKQRLEERRLQEEEHLRQEKRRLEKEERRPKEEEHLRQPKRRLEEEKKKMERRMLQKEEHQQEKGRQEEDKKTGEDSQRRLREKEHLQQDKTLIAEEMKKLEEQEEARRLEKEATCLPGERYGCARGPHVEPQMARRHYEQEVPPPRPEEEVTRRKPLASRGRFDWEEPIRLQKSEDRREAPKVDQEERVRLHAELLREALKRERGSICRLRSSLDRQKEELARMSLEKRGYMALVDQLSAQIVEMEEEMEALRQNRNLGTWAFESFELDKQKMKKQLLEMETLVLRLQELDRDQKAPPRAHLEEAHADNAALRQRLCVLQQEVDELDGEVANKRRELEELERHRESSGQEADRLQQETAAYRQEAVSLSGRNAQLSAANAELSARRQGLQAQVRRLQEEAELERGRRLRLEEELGACMRELSEMEAELSTAVTERQKMEAELRREAALGEHKAQEAESDRGSLMTDSEETDLQNQVPEKVPLDGRAPGPNPREPVQADKLEPRVARTQAEGQAGRPSSTRPVSAQACATLDVARREGVELRERAARLLARLREEQAQSRRLEEELRLRARQSAARMGLEEERHEKALAEARQRTQELEVKLKASRAVLRDKARQLQQQTAKNVKSSAMLKELYVENSQLLQALQQSERRHHHAHKDKKLLEDKVGALNRLLVDMVPAALLQA